MKPATETEVLRGLLRLALLYLEHPEVAAIDFARSSESVARQIREDGLGEPEGPA